MEILKELGLERDWIYEVIVATKINNRINPAPIGVWTRDFETLDLEVYKETQTYGGILQSRKFAVNFPGGVSDFYSSIFNKEDLVFEGETLFLKHCDAALGLGVTQVIDKGEKVCITAEIVSHKIKKNPELINRAKHLALESLVSYSKLSSASEESRLFLTERIRENLRVICKSAPGSEFQALVQNLLEEHP